MKTPNVVLCICDQLRWSELGCYGNPVIRTPNLDGMAGAGVRFETAVSNFPICMPARSVLLSGQHNRTCTGGTSNVGFLSRPGDFSMPEYPDAGRPHLRDPTLPEILRARGYHTRAIGKWHIHSWPHDIGFDDYIIPRVHHCHTGQSFTENGGPEFVPEGFSVDFEADRVERFLDSRTGRKDPFFLYYSISPPHCPVADAPEKYLKMYRPEDIPLRPNADANNPFQKRDYWYRVYRYDFRHYNLRLPYADKVPAGYGLRNLIAEYYGLTTWVDDCVGRMLAALQRNGLADDTVVVFTSDHGDLLGSHGLPQKGPFYDESIRIPLLIRWPGRVAPRVDAEQAVSLVDVMPTLLTMAGAETPAHAQGRDLLNPCRHWSVIEGGNASRAIRTPTHLYATDCEGLPKMFFDCGADPFQMRNLAGTAEQAAAAAEIGDLLSSWDRTTPWMQPEVTG